MQGAEMSMTGTAGTQGSTAPTTTAALAPWPAAIAVLAALDEGSPETAPRLTASPH